MPLPDMLPGTFELKFLEMRIFFEIWIGVRGEHFAVSVDVDPLPRGLGEKVFEVFEIMSSDEDSGAFSGLSGDCCRSWNSEVMSVGFIKDFHGGEGCVSTFFDHCQECAGVIFDHGSGFRQAANKKT